MNYIYTITDRNENSLFKKMILSLKKHSDFSLILNIFQEKSWAENFCKKELPGKVEIKYIERGKWNNRRMAYKIENIKNCNFSEGDQVFVLDDDLIAQDDIFDAFKEEFDVCLTTRHYSYWYVINAGVWGFKWNETTRKFIDFYVNQIRNPTWAPLNEFRRRYSRGSSLDWWVDQDFLCVVKTNSLPFSCNIKDLGPQYNFCPSVEENLPGTFEVAKKQILEMVGNKKYKILHLKGRLKTIEGQISI